MRTQGSRRVSVEHLLSLYCDVLGKSWKTKKAFRLKREVKAYPQLGRSFSLGEIGIDSRAFWLVLEF